MVDAVQGLLGNPLLNLGVGLLGASGPSPQPVGFGQALAGGFQFAQNAQQQNLRNQLLRQGLQQRQRRNDAMGQLRGLLEPGTVGVGEVDPRTGIATVGPEGGVQAPGAGLARAGGIQSPEVLGLLAEVAPEQFAQGLLGQVFPQERRPNSLIEQAQFAFPDDPEAQRRFVAQTAARAGAGEDQVGRMIDLMRLQQIQLDLRGQIDDQERAALERENAVRSGISRLDEILGLNDQLAAVAEETGLSFTELGAMGTGGPLAQRAAMTALTNVFGLDERTAQATISAAQRFDQLTSRQALEELALNPALSRGTNAHLRAAIEVKPGLDKNPQVNSQVAADALQTLLDAARAEGITLDQQRRLEERIEEIRQGGAAAGESGVIDFNALPE